MGVVVSKAGQGRRLRRAVALLVAAAAVLAALAAPAGSALAADGSLTVGAGGGATAFKAYCVFRADINPSGEATNVSWPDWETRQAVVGCLYERGFVDYVARNVTSPGDYSEPAAAYCAQQIAASADAAGSSADPAPKAGGSFAAGLASELASALDGRGKEPVALEAGRAAAVPQGYYLVVSDASALGAGAAATAPLWVAVGASTEVSPKATAASVSVEVRQAGAASFGRAADALAGQLVEYRVTASLPDELGAYGAYPLAVEARLDRAGTVAPMGMSIEVCGVNVTSSIPAAGELVSSGPWFRAALDDVLSMGCARAGGTVVVTFQAMKGTAPNAPGAEDPTARGECVVELTYPCDPLDASRTGTATASAYLYSHAVSVELTDAFTGGPAAPAQYSLKVLECGDQTRVGRYVNALGVPQTTEAVLDNSGEAGAAVFPGLAAGKYLIHQVGLPAGYPAQDGDVVLTVATAYDSSGGVASLTASFEGGYAADAFGSSGTAVTADAQACAVTVASTVSKTFSPPVTGLAGSAAVRACAGALALAGAALAGGGALARRRRKGGGAGAAGDE